MKRHSFAIEIITFSLIFLFFIIPPFFITGENYNFDMFVKWDFPFQQLITAIIALFLYLSFHEQKKYWLKIFPALFSFCLLFCVSLFIKFFSLIISAGQTAVTIEFPHNPITWLFCILNFLFAAFFEEVIYRFYFIDALNVLISRVFSWKYIGLICEVSGCLVFAFAHLYLGFISVINAAFAHGILRICYKKSGSVWPGTLAHFAYNFISLLIL